MYLKKVFRIGKKTTIPWENLQVFQNYLNHSMEAARRYFKGFMLPAGKQLSWWNRNWYEIITALKLSLQDSIFFIRAHFAWLRNLGLFSIKALKNN